MKCSQVLRNVRLKQREISGPPQLWVHNLVKDGELCCSLVFNTDKLRKTMEEMKPYTVMGGDNKASKMYLVNIAKLLKGITN